MVTYSARERPASRGATSQRELQTEERTRDGQIGVDLRGGIVVFEHQVGQAVADHQRSAQPLLATGADLSSRGAHGVEDQKIAEGPGHPQAGRLGAGTIRSLREALPPQEGVEER